MARSASVFLFSKMLHRARPSRNKGYVMLCSSHPAVMRVSQSCKSSEQMKPCNTHCASTDKLVHT